MAMKLRKTGKFRTYSGHERGLYFKHVKAVNLYVKAMLNDGWKWRRLYNSPGVRDTSKLGDIELVRAGFLVLVLRRPVPPAQSKSKALGTLSIDGWGPDKLQIEIPKSYSMEAFRRAVQTCNSCGRRVKEIYRFFFAGRACKKCLPALKKEFEKPGWSE